MEHNFGSESKNQRRFLLHKVFVENCIEYFNNFAAKVKLLEKKNRTFPAYLPLPKDQKVKYASEECSIVCIL